MYPLPRMLITAALFVGIAYGVVALIVLAPTHDSLVAYYLGVPIVVAVGIAIFARGEPDDQTSVHSPRMSKPSSTR